ncbi:hypothetical protein M3A96_04500 [Helcobacillus massiliensis]|uniref:hypothetical protein n=1 Tax=Helcobacillus massiliensis TaxID=521392 RepID=UPI0021A8AC6F|nr:hypothetical protein [Helcobacillus massiliensis]MCT1557380.1 hypothetical protein [Helcobacillus massiliensis]MCT2036897.1 hypothetical protein [Helcobacillus massiliensis]MCT2331665.1 hypothetical protein [Helcobacillus massiliensis]
MSEFTSSAEAFRIARERASVAAAFEANTLHMAVFDAREAGMSVREAAVALSVPKSTVARHWREGHQCTQPVPIWGSASAWREAHAVVWAHNPRELADDWVPYEWHDEADRRTVKRRHRGVAVLCRDEAATTDARDEGGELI